MILYSVGMEKPLRGIKLKYYGIIILSNKHEMYGDS